MKWKTLSNNKISWRIRTVKLLIVALLLITIVLTTILSINNNQLLNFNSQEILAETDITKITKNNLIAHKSDYIGEYVNYAEADPNSSDEIKNTKWQIFDISNEGVITLISNFLKAEYMQPADGIEISNNKFYSYSDALTLVDYLENEENWTKFKNNIAGTAKGGPSIEELVSSYNNTKLKVGVRSYEGVSEKDTLSYDKEYNSSLRKICLYIK